MIKKCLLVKTLLLLQITTLLSVATPALAVQTEITISGKVTAADDKTPLPGVNVLVKGTSNGTTTNADGSFTISVKSNDAVLSFSFIGYVPQDIPVGERSTIDVELSPDITQLSEVVVVGYGDQQKARVTGAVSSVPTDRLTNLPVTNLLQAVQGTTAGLTVQQTSSVPGSSGTWRIRGVNSINASTSPFIVLDGMPFFGNTNDINPNDIADVQILKDASAVAIYGTRGSNGVVLITTKRGSQANGRPSISFNAYGGVESMAHELTPMGPDQYVQKYADFLKANGVTQTQVLPNASEVDNYNNGVTTNWLDYATQSGKIQEYNLSISGGTPKVQYYVSATKLAQEGVVKGFQYKRTSIRSNLDAQVTDYLKVGISGFFTDNNYDGGRANLLQATAMSPYSVPKAANGDYLIYPMAPEQLFVNPMLGLTTERVDGSKNLTGNGYLELAPTFLKGFKYQLKGAYIYTIEDFASYAGRKANDQSGTANITNTDTENWVLENILSYSKDIGVHHFDVTGLYSAQKVTYFKSEAGATGFINDGVTYYDLLAGASKTANSEGNDYRLLSQMARLNYSYDNRYLITLTARRDGYSAFGANNSKYGWFPAVGLGWNIANEDFMSPLSDQISQLKFRVSHGKTGNQAVPVNQTMTTATTVQHPFNGSVNTGVLFTALGNKDLTWESTTTTNFGLDFSILKDRISGSIEYYKSKTEDILLRRNLPGITGYTDIWTNLGKMQNHGLEITLNTVNIQKQDFKWTSTIVFSQYKNELLELYGDGRDDVGNGWFIGQPLRVIYGYEKIGIWQTDEIGEYDPAAKPGDIKFKDQLTVDTDGDGKKDAGDGVINQDDRVVIGQQDPKWFGGLTNTFTYKNFNLSIFIQTSQGGLKRNADLTYADEAGRRNLPEDFQYWTEENPSNYWPSLSAYKNYRGYHFAEDWSYVRLKDIRLSYSVPSTFLSKYGISSLMIYAAGRNLYTWTNWFGWDPEMNYVSRGSTGDALNYPVVKSISLGLNLTL